MYIYINMLLWFGYPSSLYIYSYTLRFMYIDIHALSHAQTFPAYLHVIRFLLHKQSWCLFAFNGTVVCVCFAHYNTYK